MLDTANLAEKKLRQAFFKRDSHQVAKDLLGHHLVRFSQGKYRIGKVVETEVYQGFDDKASHASTRKITARNKIMYGPGGYFYIYLIYGMYWNLNVVTEGENFPAAILIRSLEPIFDADLVLDNLSGKEKFLLASGPGRLCRWMGVDKSLNGQSVEGQHLFFTEGMITKREQITSAKRIGVDYAKEDALLTWRYYLKDNPYVSVR